jgi:hypothetical protein
LGCGVQELKLAEMIGLSQELFTFIGGLMNSSQVIINLFAGALSGQTYTFDEPTVCIVGREERCHLKLPNDLAHATISRYHCLLDISPPKIRVRDFGSLNGTYVNDTKIGQRPTGISAEEARHLSYPEYDLQDGDRVKIGETVFEVKIIDREPQPQHQPQHPARGGIEFLALLQKLLNRALGGNRGDDVNLPAIRNYQIIGQLGVGGFGAVYLAEDRTTRTQVAIKIMLPDGAASSAKVQMFLREINCLKALNHPNIVRFIDMGYSSDTFFVVMEYCDGGTVQDFVDRIGRPLTVTEAMPIVMQILDGLAYSHQVPIPVQKVDGTIETMYGLVHRDLKPSNFFVCGNGDRAIMKIGDYGLAKCFSLAGLSGQTVTGGTAGTPVFMSRKQLLNFKYCQPDVDVWAVAACFYYLLTGQFPRDFRRGDPLQIILTSPTIPIGQRGLPIPPRLAAVIDRALNEGDGNQPLAFSTAIDFQRALKDALI